LVPVSIFSKSDLVLVPALSGCAILSDLISGCSVNTNPKVGPPAGTVAERDVWGQKNIRGIYVNTVEWLEESAIVRQEVGKIKSISPIGTPNFYKSCYSESVNAQITLEIIGEKTQAIFSGRGYLTNELDYNDSNGTLIVGNKKIEIHSSGLSMEQFNQPKTRISIIKYYISHYYSLDSIGRVEHLEKLAEAYAEIGDYENAISNIQSAKGIFIKHHKNDINHLGSKREFVGFSDYSKQELQRLLQQEALYRDLSNKKTKRGLNEYF
jgi:hypothetical protein